MRVPYAPKEASTEADKPIYERIAARRNPRPLIPLDLALLHNPQVADGWNSFIGAIRTKTTLGEDIKELAIARVAVLNQAVHEWNVHAQLALKGGVSKQGMETVATSAPVKVGDAVREDDGEGLTKLQWAVLAYTDQMTRGVQVDEALSQRLKGLVGDKQLVELTVTIGAYNCVSRFLVALDVGEENGKQMKSVEEMASSETMMH